MRVSPTIFAALVIACACSAGNARAHDLWLEREAAQLTLLQGHRTKAHAGSERIPYAADFVRQVTCTDDSGAEKHVAFTPAYPLRLQDGCATLVLQASSGYWTKTAWETRNVPKAGISGVLRSWRADEVVKRIDRWHPTATRSLPAGLDISPQENPFSLAIDSKLRLRVTVDGQPRSGVPVAYDGATRGASGDDGSIVLRLRHGGLQMITASIESPLADGKADLLVQTVTLNFELPEK